ncbi:MAG: hypothetical protein IJ763_08930 [Lachnospiraceae bacterium]|nr:hypothetical protein [Lachnospiraceae bacterium]
MPFSKGFDGIKLWFASNLMNLIIASIVILLISSIINVGHLRQIVLVITSICFFFALVVMGEDARPGFSVLLILAGIIAGFASCAEDLKAPKKEFEPVTDYAKDILDKGGWVCNECGKVNPKYLTTCKCGNSKPS